MMIDNSMTPPAGNSLDANTPAKTKWIYDRMRPTYIKNISCLCTLQSNSANNKLLRRGKEMNDIGVIEDGAIVFLKDRIIFVGTTTEAEDFLAANNMPQCNSDSPYDAKEILEFYNQVIDGRGLTITPGLCDSHTHIVFAGNRSGEFIDRLNGATYAEIAAKGGGILKTMTATRYSTIKLLFRNAFNIAAAAASFGTTSMEVKSGYSLNDIGEYKQLDAIAKLQKQATFMNFLPTFLGAHDFPPEYKDAKQEYILQILESMLPEIARRKTAIFCDAFIDKGYYSTDEARQIFEKATELGFKIKAHADELADVDAASLAVDLGAISADHLLCISDKNINKMANSNTIATLLPATAYCLRIPYAPARKLIDNGCAVALATDCNPGTSFTENMQLVMSLAVMQMNMSPEEALTAATINGAAAMDIANDRGSIETGKKADLAVFGCSSYKDIFYHIGTNHLMNTYSNGIMYNPFGIRVWKIDHRTGYWKRNALPWAVGIVFKPANYLFY